MGASRFTHSMSAAPTSTGDHSGGGSVSAAGDWASGLAGGPETSAARARTLARAIAAVSGDLACSDCAPAGTAARPAGLAPIHEAVMKRVKTPSIAAAESADEL